MFWKASTIFSLDLLALSGHSYLHVIQKVYSFAKWYLLTACMLVLPLGRPKIKVYNNFG